MQTPETESCATKENDKSEVDSRVLSFLNKKPVPSTVKVSNWLNTINSDTSTTPNPEKFESLKAHLQMKSDVVSCADEKIPDPIADDAAVNPSADMKVTTCTSAATEKTDLKNDSNSKRFDIDEAIERERAYQHVLEQELEEERRKRKKLEDILEHRKEDSKKAACNFRYASPRIGSKTSAFQQNQSLSHASGPSSLHNHGRICIGCNSHTTCHLITSRNFLMLLRQNSFTCQHHSQLVTSLESGVFSPALINSSQQISNSDQSVRQPKNSHLLESRAVVSNLHCCPSSSQVVSDPRTRTRNVKNHCDDPSSVRENKTRVATAAPLPVKHLESRSVAPDAPLPVKSLVSRSVATDAVQGHSRSVATDAPLPVKSHTRSIATAAPLPVKSHTRSIATAAPLPVKSHTRSIATAAPLPVKSHTRSIATAAPLPVKSHSRSIATAAPLPVKSHSRSIAPLPSLDYRSVDAPLQVQHSECIVRIKPLQNVTNYVPQKRGYKEQV